MTGPPLSTPIRLPYHSAVLDTPPQPTPPHLSARAVCFHPFPSDQFPRQSEASLFLGCNAFSSFRHFVCVTSLTFIPSVGFRVSRYRFCSCVISLPTGRLGGNYASFLLCHPICSPLPSFPPPFRVRFTFTLPS